MAAAEPLEEPDAGASRRAEPAFPDQPAGVQGLSSEGKPGAVVELHLRRSHDQLPAEVDGSTEMAAAQAVRETRRYPIEAPGGHRELLSNQGPHGCSRSREWEHPDAHQSRARLQESALPPAQGQATVGQQPRTPRRAPNHESHVICSLCQILAQRANLMVEPVFMAVNGPRPMGTGLPAHECLHATQAPNVTSGGGACMRTRGFSIIELLVVITII